MIFALNLQAKFILFMGRIPNRAVVHTRHYTIPAFFELALPVINYIYKLLALKELGD